MLLDLLVGSFLQRFREKLMKKRIERLLSVHPLIPCKIHCFREKLMKKRIERIKRVEL